MLRTHNNIPIVAGLCIVLLCNGCTLLAVGAAGVAGGYAVSNDGVEGIFDKNYNQLWQVAHDVLGRQGNIQIADKGRGIIQAKVGGSDVKFHLEQATPHSVVLRVQARKFQKIFPDMDLARRLYSMILKEAG